MITPIITAAEADVFLAAYPDWLALDSAVKDAHLYNASLYIQTQYTCLDVDWTDPLTIPEEVKNACALYALADSVGNLYGNVETPDTRRTTRELVKAGSVTVEEEFAAGGSNETGTTASFSKPDTLMSLHCTKNSSCAGCGASVTRN